jgi:hypothetical protein
MTSRTSVIMPVGKSEQFIEEALDSRGLPSTMKLLSSTTPPLTPHGQLLRASPIQVSVSSMGMGAALLLHAISALLQPSANSRLSRP